VTLISRAKSWARIIQRDVVALWLAARDPRVPWHAKAIAAAVAAYALSPIDLVPDFIPVLGYIDDLLIVPLGIMAAVKLIPAPVMADLRLKALDVQKPRSTIGLIAILAIWLILSALAAWFAWPTTETWLANR
jgi:uncharacterized membrane protein YkvA (DUF1232 family)